MPENDKIPRAKRSKPKKPPSKASTAPAEDSMTTLARTQLKHASRYHVALAAYQDEVAKAYNEYIQRQGHLFEQLGTKSAEHYRNYLEKLSRIGENLDEHEQCANHYSTHTTALENIGKAIAKTEMASRKLLGDLGDTVGADQSSAFDAYNDTVKSVQHKVVDLHEQASQSAKKYLGSLGSLYGAVAGQAEQAYQEYAKSVGQLWHDSKHADDLQEALTDYESALTKSWETLQAALKSDADPNVSG